MVPCLCGERYRCAGTHSRARTIVDVSADAQAKPYGNTHACADRTFYIYIYPHLRADSAPNSDASRTDAAANCYRHIGAPHGDSRPDRRDGDARSCRYSHAPTGPNSRGDRWWWLFCSGRRDGSCRW